MTTTSRLGMGVFAIALAGGCMTETEEAAPSTTTTTEQAAYYGYNVALPALYVWDGTPIPLVTKNRVLLASNQYAGWYVLSQVDVYNAKVPWARWIHQSQLQKAAPYLIEAAIVGPGGNPPPPPCETWGTCHVAAAQRAVALPAQALSDAESFGKYLPPGTP